MSKTEIAKVLAGKAFRVLLAAGAILALASAGGCGDVTAAQDGPAATTGGARAAGGGPGAAGQAGAPSATTGGTGGQPVASGAGGGSPAGHNGATGGAAAGGQGGAVPISCGGPGYGAALCSHDSDCLSGKCAGGWCTDCGPGGCKAPAKCIDNGWVPDPVQDCSPSSEPLCMWGYRCLNCGPFPGAITACVYDRAGTSICVASCADCAAR